MAKKKSKKPKQDNQTINLPGPPETQQPDQPPSESQQQDKKQKAEKSAEKEMFRIKNTVRAGQAVYGVTGKPVEFDEEGIAAVPKAEFEHFLKVPGYTKA